MAEQPPEADGSSFACLVIGDHPARAVDPGSAGGGLEVGGFGQRVAAADARLAGEVAVDVQERRARDVALEPFGPAGAGMAEHVAAVDDPEAGLAEVDSKPGRVDQRSKGSSHGRKATRGARIAPGRECGPSESRIWRLWGPHTRRRLSFRAAA